MPSRAARPSLLTPSSSRYACLMGDCQDCERCTASLVSRFGRGLLAVGTLGISEVAIGVVDAFKRTCPTCKHPLGMHEGARIRIMNQAPPAVAVPMPVYVPIPPAPAPSASPVVPSTPNPPRMKTTPRAAAQPDAAEPTTTNSGRAPLWTVCRNCRSLIDYAHETCPFCAFAKPSNGKVIRNPNEAGQCRGCSGSVRASDYDCASCGIQAPMFGGSS